MCTGRGKRGYWQAGLRPRYLFAALLCVGLLVSNQPGFVANESWIRATSAVLISPASASKSRKNRPGSALGQWAAKQKSLKQLQQIEATQKQVQAAQQQVQAAQQQVQQIQATIKQVQASQQQAQAVQQQVQQVQAALKKGERHDRGARHKHEQTALTSTKSAPQPTSNHASVGQYQAKLQNVLAKLRGPHHSATDGSHGRVGGGHHQALLKAVAAKVTAAKVLRLNDNRTLGDNVAGREGGQHQSRHQAVFQHALARLKGHPGSGHSHERPPEVRQQAVFRLMMSKLSGYRHRQEKQTKPAETPKATAETPKATPAPASTAASKGPILVSTLPTAQAAVPNTSLLSQVSQAASQVSQAASQVVSQVTGGGTSQQSSTNEGAGLAGTISRLGGPQQPKQSTDTEPANSRTVKKIDDNGGDNDNKGLKRLQRALGGQSAAGALLPPVGSFKPSEVLAINLSGAGLAAALQNNYAVLGKTEFPGFGINLTLLKTPDGQSAVTGRNALLDLVPKGAFSLNRVYAPYRMGLGMGSPAKGGAGCTADRCFGAGLIKWQPQLATCVRDIKIGIIDTGFDSKHPAFEGLRASYADFVPKNAKPVPQHGTAVLSLLAGSAKSTTPGLIPHASYSIANAFYADGNGQAISDTTHMLKALEWLKGQGVAVANLSFSGPEDELIHEAIRQMTAAGMVVVSAAGNDGPGAPPSYPAAYKEVIAVTAVDRKGAVYTYANRGSYVDVAAPGVGVWTALPGKREGEQTGTSFAVPYVTAVIAVNPPTGLNGDPLAPKQHALAMLQKNVRVLSGQGVGAGLVQAPSDCGAPSVAGTWSTSTVHAVKDTKR